MRVRIFTFHWATNHGAILQAFALSSYIKKSIKDVDVEIVNYYPKSHERTFLRAFLTKHPDVVVSRLKDWRKEKYLRPFRSKLSLTKRFYSQNDINEISLPADIAISGSDQIWNAAFTLYGEGKTTTTYFLPFPWIKKRISYAASFGCTKLDSRVGEIAKPLLNDFNSISVREETGKEILKELGLEGKTVCDPTMLLEASDYPALPRTNEKDDFVAVYYLRKKDKNTKKYLSSLCNAVAPQIKQYDIEMTSIEGWLAGIRDAMFLVTNSFHGMVFAIQYHTPFAIILEDNALKGMNDRFTTVLRELGLSNRVIASIDEMKALCNDKIAWDIVDEKRRKWSQFSKAYLLEKLSDGENV